MRVSLLWKRLLRDNRGATAIEYGLILAFICIIIIASLQSTADEIIKMWMNVASTSDAAINGSGAPGG